MNAMRLLWVLVLVGLVGCDRDEKAPAPQLEESLSSKATAPKAVEATSDSKSKKTDGSRTTATNDPKAACRAGFAALKEKKFEESVTTTSRGVELLRKQVDSKANKRLLAMCLYNRSRAYAALSRKTKELADLEESLQIRENSRVRKQLQLSSGNKKGRVRMSSCVSEEVKAVDDDDENEVGSILKYTCDKAIGYTRFVSQRLTDDDYCECIEDEQKRAKCKKSNEPDHYSYSAYQVWTEGVWKFQNGCKMVWTYCNTSDEEDLPVPTAQECRQQNLSFQRGFYPEDDFSEYSKILGLDD